MSSANWRGEGTREWDIAHHNYNEGIVNRVDGSSVTYDKDPSATGGWGVGFPEGYPVPKVGDTLRVYGEFGRPFHGMDVNGEPVWYSTIAEQDAKHAAMVARMDAEHEAKFVEQEAELDRQFDELPDPLRLRMAQMRKSGGREWRVKWEGYEMFVSTQAVVIASLGSVEAIDRWVSINSKEPPDGYEPYDYKRQRAEAPKGYDDGHSGNTFGAAVALAKMLVEGEQERLTLALAAGTPLGGEPRYPYADDD